MNIRTQLDILKADTVGKGTSVNGLNTLWENNTHQFCVVQMTCFLLLLSSQLLSAAVLFKLVLDEVDVVSVVCIKVTFLPCHCMKINPDSSGDQ